MMLLDIVKNAIKPITGLIDELHTSGEEKLQAKTALLQVEQQLASAILDYEGKLATERGAIIRAEAAGHSFLQRNWRPIIMLLFGYIIAHNWVIAPIFGVPYTPVPEDLWQLLKIGLGGYVIGRSAEKIVPATMAALKEGNSKK